MSLSRIRDQEVPIRVLRSLLRRRRIPNALLFWGPGGVGKRLTALELAKAVNCRQGDADACDQCLSCRKADRGNHPDIRAVVPLKRARIINVETIESVNEMAALRPFESTWRIIILLDADRMRPDAQNKFLKTLEEPPGNSLFILVTEIPRLLLPTIRSRCQMLRFGALKPRTVLDLLVRDRDLPPDLAQAIAELAQGQMSRALDLVDTEKRTIALDITKRLAEGGDPVTLADEFTKHLAAQRDHIQAGLKAESQDGRFDELTREDRERVYEEQAALLDALCRRDIMEYLYLWNTLYRDEMVWQTTHDAAHVLNRDQLERFKNAKPADQGKKIAAIAKAQLYLERFLKEERVFRDLFFVLAE